MTSPQREAWQQARPRHLTGLLTGVSVIAMMITPGVEGAAPSAQGGSPRSSRANWPH